MPRNSWTPLTGKWLRRWFGSLLVLVGAMRVQNMWLFPNPRPDWWLWFSIGPLLIGVGLWLILKRRGRGIP